MLPVIDQERFSTLSARGILHACRHGWPSISCAQMITDLSQLAEAMTLRPELSGLHATSRTQSACEPGMGGVSWDQTSASHFHRETR